MSICQLLKHHIDEHKISMKDIAKAGDFNISSLRSAIYNDRLTFEKFCKVEILVGFDLTKPLHFNMLAERYEMDADEMKKRLTTYAKALKNKAAKKEEKITVEEVLTEAQEDTANLALEIKMVEAAEKADKKKPIPVPESLDQEVEAVINNENVGETVENVAEAVESVANPVEADDKEPVAEIDYMLITNYAIADLKGLEALFIGGALMALYQYKDQRDVADLKEARKCLTRLISFLEAL